MSESEKLRNLVTQITQTEKREEFFRLASELKPVDELLLLMKQQTDSLIANARLCNNF
ncbi:hypothetical protein [Leptolyngbya sp. FACHB-261]|uniref:hypothetical protein n=1 Tax=Leptolyngbya sp. FACHB-261 TaxID=2692806 RepID=UPI001683BE54|nr:hypothetical protein [Leptolyngbya sp. FACHB-261]MBD2101781.1 hypothetical protein [Leptolyngbya sp. FACHB-261]